MEKIKVVNKNKINPFAYLRSKYLDNGAPISIRKLDSLMGGIVGHSHISELEKGKISPSYKQLKAYHNFFHVSYEFLLGETEDVNSLYTGEAPILDSEVDKAIYQLSMSNKKIDRNKWHTINMMLTTEKGKLLLFYLAELLNSDEHFEIYEKIEILLNQVEELTYTELMLKIENEVNSNDNTTAGK